MANLEMRSTTLSVTRDFSYTVPLDARQVPATGATVSAYRQGATVTEGVVCYDRTDTVVSVANTGRVQVGDQVQVGIDGTRTLVVHEVGADGRSLTLLANTGDDIYLDAGNRLLVTSAPAAIFRDASGLMGFGGGNTTSVDGTGHAHFYCGENRFDCLVSGAGLSTVRMILDVVGGWARGGESLVNAKDYPTLQEALDSCPAGGRMYLPAGIYVVPDGGLVIDRPLELFGDGPQSTILRAHSVGTTQQPQPVIVLAAGGAVSGPFHLHDFQVTSSQSPQGRNARDHGISCVVPDQFRVDDVRLERVYAVNLAGDGFHFEGHDLTSGAIVFLYGAALQANSCWGSGFYFRFGAGAVELHNCFATGNQLYGAVCDESAVAWYACAFVGNCKATQPAAVNPAAGTLQYDGVSGAQLRLFVCAPARVDACDVEDFGRTSADPNRLGRTGVLVECCNGALVSNTSFYALPDNEEQGGVDPGSCGVKVTGGSTEVPEVGWATIMPCSFVNVGTPVDVSLSAQRVSVWPQRNTIEGQGANIPFSCRGIAVPESSGPLPLLQLTSGPHLVWDSSLGRLRCWDASTLTWRTLSWT